MTLQVIKAEDVRDGEPRIWLAHRQDMPHATTRTMHTSSRRDVGCQSCEFAIVDRPAPFTAAQPPPVLDLDALAEAERAMTVGPWPIVDPNDREPGPPVWCGSNFGGVAAIGPIHYDADEDETVPGSPAYIRAESDSRGIVALRNAAPHLIAEARAAVALRQELAALRAHFDAAAPEHNLPALLDLYNDRTTEAREKLAEAKRLGLEACDAAQMSDDQMMWATINITAIRAALEAL